MNNSPGKKTRISKKASHAPEEREFIYRFDGNWTPELEKKALEYLVKRIETEGKIEPVARQVSLEKSITPEAITGFILGKLTLGELFGLTVQEAYGIAQFGYNYMQQGKYGLAEAIFKGLITMIPNDGYFHTCLGALYQRNRRNKEAIEEYTAALQCDPQDWNALVNRGELNLMQGKLSEAIKDFEMVVQIGEGSKAAAQRVRALSAIVTSAISEKLRSGA